MDEFFPQGLRLLTRVSPTSSAYDGKNCGGFNQGLDNSLSLLLILQPNSAFYFNEWQHLVQAYWQQ